MQEHLSVSEATALIKDCLESSLPALWVEGEISNFVAHTSGHFYFSLKDETAQLRCVMFRGANRRLRFVPEDGLAYAAFGAVTVYARSGQYQLIAERLVPLGEGDLALAFERLKERLAAEGLFDAARKRPLPRFPETVGVVTSPTGAAVRDILRVLRRRWPSIRVILRPVRVQGEGAAEEIATGLAALDRLGEADVLIVGRGGGSLEDL
jgi:exodeoxyribonuclease VII large subunit